MSLPRRFRHATRLSVALLTTGGIVLAASGTAFASGTFNPGDLVAEVAAGTTSTSAQISLWDYNTTGPVVGNAVTTFSDTTATDTASSHALVDSASATYNGEIALSGDGQYLYVGGYDDNAGVATITSSVGVPRTVGIVSATGIADTSTALTASSPVQSGLTATKINFRTAVGQTGGTSSFYNGGDNGIGYSADGATTDSALNTDTIHQLQILNGTLFESTATAINQVGTAGTLPTSATPTNTSLIATYPSKFEPAGFGFANLGSGNGPTTLYVADTGNNAVEKYEYNGTTYVADGSVTVSNVTGLAVTVSGTTATIYASNASTIYTLTDANQAGSLTGTPATTFATVPTGDSFHGIAFAPGTALPNNGDTPEFALAIILPALGLMLFGGYVVYRRRYQAA